MPEDTEMAWMPEAWVPTLILSLSGGLFGLSSVFSVLGWSWEDDLPVVTF